MDLIGSGLSTRFISSHKSIVVFSPSRSFTTRKQNATFRCNQDVKKCLHRKFLVEVLCCAWVHIFSSRPSILHLTSWRELELTCCQRGVGMHTPWEKAVTAELLMEHKHSFNGIVVTHCATFSRFSVKCFVQWSKTETDRCHLDELFYCHRPPIVSTSPHFIERVV